MRVTPPGNKGAPGFPPARRLNFGRRRDIVPRCPIAREPMDTHSRHLLAEYWECDRARLDDQDYIAALLERAALATGATVVETVFHRFAPQGVSGVVVIEESHLSIHTWPERGYAAVDFFTCGDTAPENGHPVLVEGLGAGRSELMLVRRGRPEGMEVGDA